MKKLKKGLFVFGATTIAALSLTSCDISSITGGAKQDQPVEIPDGENDNPVNEDQIYEIYLLAKDAGYAGTYQEWLASIKGEKGEKGDKGEDGVGIASIEKLSTEGLVDTYVIILSNGTRATFTIQNAPAPEEVVTHNVTFVTEDGNQVTQTIVDGQKVKKIAYPEKQGYQCVGWQCDGEE